MPKVISTTIEDEVTFLTNVDVEYVSLVRHGANRTPFRILKNDKGGSTMEKVVTAVLIPKSISEDDAAGHLDGYRTDEMKEYDSYKSYIQVDQETIDADTAEVVFLDKEAGVMGVVASLVADKDEDVEPKDPENPDTNPDEGAEPDAKNEEIEPKKVEKDALDYATMDELYMELYAMADIVGGALRQSQIEPNSRKSTVLTAIDNFRTFASMVLDNAKSDDAVKAEDHPDLAHHLPKAEKEESAEPAENAEPAESTEPEGKTEDPEGDKSFDEDAFMEKVMEKVNELLAGKVSTEDLETKVKEVTDSVTESSTKTQETLTAISEKLDALKDIPTTVNNLSETVEKLENTPVTAKADADDVNDGVQTKTGAFAGTIFSNFRSQE